MHLDRRQLLRGLSFAYAIAARVPLRFGIGLVALPLSRQEFAETRSGVEWALVQTGYLPPGGARERTDADLAAALIRFQRQARSVYRLDRAAGLPRDAAPREVFPEEATGAVTPATVAELQRWVREGWMRPMGRFRFASVSEGMPRPPFWLRWAILRNDVAARWRELMAEFEARGGTLLGPYGDTRRKIGLLHRDGASPRSFHVTGRAIDLNQQLAVAPSRRYYILPEGDGPRHYWRVLCRAQKQDGSQGAYFAARARECWRYVPRKEREGAGGGEEARKRSRFPLPPGWYLDLTAFLEEQGRFERIPAQAGWETNYLRSEWWHYQYRVGKQAAFVDECELVGITEAQLLAAGYPAEELLRHPG